MDKKRGKQAARLEMAVQTGKQKWLRKLMKKEKEKRKAKVCGRHRQQNKLETSGIWREEVLGHTGDDHTAVTAGGCGNFATAV